MATPTDLEGALRTDEDCLALRFGKLFATLGATDGTEFVAVNVRWRGQGAVSWERLSGDEAMPVKVDSAGIDGIIAKIEAMITDRLGPSPFGVIKIQAYPPGKSLNPPLNFQRTLIPSESGGLGEPNLQLVRGLLQEERATNRHLTGMLIEGKKADSIMVQSLAQSLQASATTRTATTAAGDIGTVGNLIGLVLLVVGAPYIKQALGLAPDAPLTDVIEATRRTIGEKMPTGEPDPPREIQAPRPPAGALDVSPEELPEGQAQPEAPPARPLPGQVARELKAKLQADPETARLVLEELTRDPEILAILRPAPAARPGKARGAGKVEG